MYTGPGEWLVTIPAGLGPSTIRCLRRMSLSSGMLFGQYRIGRKLGSGGMGEVYQATHLSLDREVALKTLQADAADGHITSLIKEARATSARSALGIG